MLVVEPVQGGDLDPVVRLANRSLLERYGEAWVQRHMDTDRSTLMVAREVRTNEVVGFAVAEKDDAREGHLLALAVDEMRRGQGIGSALLRSVQDRMASQGTFRLNLDVRADDLSAQGFYQRHGFYPEGLKSHVYADGADAVRMSRPMP